MSLEVSWNVMDSHRTEARTMTVGNALDVERLVSALAADSASDALIYHQGRPMLDPLEGFEDDEILHDHHATVGALNSWGYFSYTDEEHELSSLAGDPSSPPFHGEICDHPAGSGIPLDLLKAAIVEFLETADRPRCVNWKSISGL
jgi:immunity protein Imm1 of predicted polymorphic toxin system